MAREAGFPIVGPNCLGIYAPGHMDTFFLPGERIIRPDKGNIGFVSQSGGVLVDQMVKFAGQGIGISLAVSIGNKAGLREIHMLEYFENDPETRVIAFYIEGFDRGEGREFIKAAERCSKPVVVLKAGKSPRGMAAASSHTASIAGDYRIFSEIMKQHCVAEADNEFELASFCESLSCYPKGIRGRVGIVSLSGGHGVLAADACAAQEVDIPDITPATAAVIREKLSPGIQAIAGLSNPLDLTGSCVDEDIIAAVRHLSRDENIDCLLALLLPYSPGISADIGAKLSQVARNEGKPMIAYVPNEDKYKIIIEGFELNQIPVASSVEGGSTHGKGVKKVPTMLILEKLNKLDKACIRDSKERGWVLEPDAKAMLERHGFDLPGRLLTDSLDDATKFMNDLSAPVVVKAVSPKILHKTEFNAVAVGIETKERLEGEMTRLLALDGCKSVLVEEMVGGMEIFVGAKNDAQFGPVVILGMGGTAVEIYNDTAIRMAPVTPDDVESMVNSLKASILFTGFRGGQGVNMLALTDMVVRFSHLSMALEPEFQSMDLNPVICGPERCTVADARIMLTA